MSDDEQGAATHRRVPAVTRAVAILRRLGGATEPVGVNQIARDLNLIPSTCLHILRVLVEEGLVDFDTASKRYAIGVGILPIARNAIQRNGFATLVQPLLADLSAQFGVTAIATQLVEAQQMVVVALAQAKQPFRISAEIGSRFPAFISATGRCVAAFGGFEERELRRRFGQLNWDNPPSYDGWRAQLEETRRTGYGVDRGEYIAGVSIVAAPLFDREGRVSRSLVAIGIAEKIEAAGAARIAAELIRMRDRAAGALVAG